MPRNPENLKKLVTVIASVRSTFQHLKTLTDAMHADLGLTASMRAVLEHLIDRGEETVPLIARSKNVTRQHIQQLADSLVAAGFAEFADNPSHKRSQLLRATAKGRSIFETARGREAKVLARIARTFDPEDLDGAIVTLRALTEGLACERIDNLDGPGKHASRVTPVEDRISRVTKAS